MIQLATFYVSVSRLIHSVIHTATQGVFCSVSFRFTTKLKNQMLNRLVHKFANARMKRYLTVAIHLERKFIYRHEHFLYHDYDVNLTHANFLERQFLFQSNGQTNEQYEK